MPAASTLFNNKPIRYIRAFLGLGRTGSKIDQSQQTQQHGPAFFEVDLDVTAAQIIAGPVTVVPDSMVPPGYKLYLTDYQIRWGGTAFTTATDVRISDTNSTPVDFVTVTVANTGSNNIHRLSPTGVTQTGVTQGAGIVNRGGGTSGKGLQIRTTGSTPAAGSAFSVYVRGYFSP